MLVLNFFCNDPVGNLLHAGRASSILEDFNWAPTLVLRVHIIVGMASKGKIAA